MKQHITEEQLNELTIDQKRKLLEWLQEEGYLGYIDDLGGCGDPECCIDRNIDERDIEPLTIGQMIEFLDEKDKLSKIETPKNWIEEGQWTVWDGITFIDGDELCNTLWEAVKEVL